MNRFIRINGVDVHYAYVITNILWVITSLVLSGVVSIQVRRLYLISKHARAPLNFRTLCVQWAHIATVCLLLLVAGVDVCQVYSEETKFVDSLLSTFWRGIIWSELSLRPPVLCFDADVHHKRQAERKKAHSPLSMLKGIHINIDILSRRVGPLMDPVWVSSSSFFPSESKKGVSHIG